MRCDKPVRESAKKPLTLHIEHDICRGVAVAFDYHCGQQDYQMSSSASMPAQQPSSHSTLT